MDTQIILIYCLCDDLLKAMHHQEDQQCRMSDAEVMTVALVAALHYRGNFALAGRMLSAHGYLRVMLDKSRFSRRLHRVKGLFLTLFALLGEHFKAMNEEAVYLIDSFPIPACDNYRIPRSKRYRGVVDAAGNLLHYRDYEVLHLGAQYRFGRSLTFSARVNNLLDEDFTSFQTTFAQNADGSYTPSYVDDYNNKDKARNYWLSVSVAF